MSDFKKVRDQINEARGNDYNVIPSFFSRFRAWFPGIMRRLFTIITANSGVGKSIFMRKVYLYDPIKFIEEHPEQNINFHAMVFLLEESKEEFILSGISKQLWERYKISISTRDLLSYFNNKALKIESKVTDDVLAKIDEIEPYFNKLEKYVELIDHIRNPTGIWVHIRKYAFDHGKFYWVHKDSSGKIVFKRKVEDIFKKNSDNTPHRDSEWNHYEPNDPNEFVLIIIDHIGLLSQESQLSQHGTIGRLSSEYLIRARNHFGYSPVVVQQQASDKEKIETNFRGETIQDKLEPSLDGLANNKETQRDANVVYGLFGPARYGIKEHNGYDITRLGNSYRYIKCLKDRGGEPNVGISLYFNGKVGEFQELPSSMDFDNKPKLYNEYPEIRADS